MRVARWRRWTIGRELAVLVVATLLPFAILGGFWAIEGYRAEQTQIQGQALSLARSVSADLDQLVSDTASLVEALARVPSIKRVEDPHAAQLLTDLVERYSYYDSLFALDATGQVLASGGQGGLPPGNRQNYVREALRSAATVVTDPLPPRGTGRRVFVVATPLWDESGKPIGVVGASVNLLRLQEGMRRAELPENSSVLIVDQAGRIVTKRTDQPGWVGRSALGSSVVRDALRLRQGVSEGNFLDGIRRLSGFAAAKRVPWEVIVGIPTDQAYGTLRRELLRAMARLALAAMVAGAAAWVLSRRLTQPIGRLAVAARAYAAGDLNHRTPGVGPEEVAALGATLNRMAGTLQQQMAALQEAQRREREANQLALAELNRLHSEFIAV
ncbi:MAG: cache domain-containing protein, partial [Chloroflexota bacterium]